MAVRQKMIIAYDDSNGILDRTLKERIFSWQPSSKFLTLGHMVVT